MNTTPKHTILHIHNLLWDLQEPGSAEGHDFISKIKENMFLLLALSLVQIVGGGMNEKCFLQEIII